MRRARATAVPRRRLEPVAERRVAAHPPFDVSSELAVNHLQPIAGNVFLYNPRYASRVEDGFDFDNAFSNYSASVLRGRSGGVADVRHACSLLPLPKDFTGSQSVAFVHAGR